MSRLGDTFRQVDKEQRQALIAYVCPGDPSMAATESLVPALLGAGADIVELGIPFSDPLADGPTIQAASQRALDGGVTPAKVLELVAGLRRKGVTAPLVLMGYLNPIIAMGVEVFCAAAQRAGVDGLIVPDLPLDEADELGRRAEAHGLDLILLAAPTTTPTRLKAIAERTRGFLYFVSVTGVTGARVELPPELPERLAEARRLCPVPVAVGFGISTPEQARSVGQHADAVVVGSAIVQRFHEARGNPETATELVHSLARALRAPR